MKHVSICQTYLTVLGAAKWVDVLFFHLIQICKFYYLIEFMIEISYLPDFYRKYPWMLFI